MDTSQVAAGNGAANAANSSPARVPEAVTVGSSNINDARSSFSNFGPIVDIFGPGENVISTSNMGDVNIPVIPCQTSLPLLTSLSNPYRECEP